MLVEVALSQGDRLSESEEYRDVRRQVVLGAGASVPVTITADFEPDSLVADPDVMVLQIFREKARHSF